MKGEKSQPNFIAIPKFGKQLTQHSVKVNEFDSGSARA